MSAEFSFMKVSHSIVRAIALNNLVLNPSGEEDGGVEADLVQEHMNLLVKVSFVHGTSMSVLLLNISGQV